MSNFILESDNLSKYSVVPRISMSQQYEDHNSQLWDQPSSVPGFMSFDDLMGKTKKEEEKEKTDALYPSPPPDFSVVSDEILTAMVAQYGLKKQNRKLMIKHLQEVWAYETHGCMPKWVS